MRGKTKFKVQSSSSTTYLLLVYKMKVVRKFQRHVFVLSGNFEGINKQKADLRACDRESLCFSLSEASIIYLNE